MIEITDVIKKETGLLIDASSQQSRRTTNGNMAREFFRKSDYFAPVLNINKEFIDSIGQLVACLNTTSKINSELYLRKSEEVYDYWEQNYNFRSITPSIHRMLVYGHEYLTYFDIPLGFLSEQAIKNAKKFIKYARIAATSKKSRRTMMRDLFNYLTLISFPGLTELICY